MASIIDDADIQLLTEREAGYYIDYGKYGRTPQQSPSTPTDDAASLALVIARLDRLIAAIEKPQFKPEETLWNSDQVAEWLGLSKPTVESRVISRQDFPSALRPVDSKQAQRRWFASDVMQWARSTAGTIPPSRVGRRRKAV